MTKRLFRIYVSYGKGDGEELSDQFVLEDTAENREELIEDENVSSYYVLDNIDDFISGKIDYLNIMLDGGDWDDPTGMAIVVYDKDDLINEEKARHKREMSEIERLFKEGE